MRLKCIKLAGFKSFVDPTTVPFPSNLCAIVGPNGCGKSNTIDAVRWVLGESSAKNLRGESMTDVIFNGSNGRKPVGQASIELVFDNTDQTLIGEYASFNEISIKRRVTREGQSTYYLNGTKCRRRDITDIFMGTGLGPRSYAIIEQGMISRLIESKPEELRVYVEEAAGISKYKERRRDTENRIRRTRENMERLTDLRDELDRQLQHLHRQAQAAEKYKELKQEERVKKAQLYALRWKDLDSQVSGKQEVIRGLEVQLEAFIADQRAADAEIESKRELHTELNDEYSEVQAKFYGLGADISGVEQSIQHTTQRTQQLNSDLSDAERNAKEVREELTLDEERLEELNASLMELEPELELMQAAEDESSLALVTAEEAMQNWQNQWDQFNQKAAEPRQVAEVQQSKIQHLEQAIQRLRDRIKKMEDESRDLSSGPVSQEIEQLQEQLAELDLRIEDQQMKLEAFADSIEEKRDANTELSHVLDQKRSDLQSMRGRHASLDALQQAAMGQGKGVVKWLEQRQWQNKPRLADGIEVADGWDKAVETVLGNHLQAVCVEGLDSVSSVLESLEQGSLTLVDTQASVQALSGDQGTLLNSKATAKWDVSGFLAGVYIAEDLNEALSKRAELNAQESIITKDGIWIGANWLRVARDEDSQAGVIQRKQELEELTDKIDDTEVHVEELNMKLREGRESLKDIEREREETQRSAGQVNREHGEVRSQLGAKQVRVEQITARKERTQQEIDDCSEQVVLEQENLGEARLLLQEALDSMEDDADARESLLRQRDESRVALDDVRQKARHDKDNAHQLALRQQSITTQLNSTKQALERLRAQAQRVNERQQALELQLEENDSPVEDLRMKLEGLLDQRLKIEEQMTAAKQKLDAAEHDMRQGERKRMEAEQKSQGVRTTLEKARLDSQTMDVRRSTLDEQLQEEQFDLETVLGNMPEDANEKEWEQELTHVASRISRLGAINLAAIDEYEAQSERKKYLDSQNMDLEQALETLDNAIRKIDRETRTRFKETFDKVNSGLQELFPKVFGGGHAYLAMTGEDLLDTGITIMARPPGKKNSTIHLLSGGEKALTAIALVFSIFQLNPAPFCMLDEVDAPLDDANVARYARLVKEMSHKVQFIYITHNKIAMEMAQQLMGVTMHEPGVSRLVAVDVEEAAELAAS